MARPLEVSADLDLAVDGERIDVQADGKRIVVDLPSLQAGQRLLEAVPIADDLRKQSGPARQALGAAGLTVEVQLQGASIAVVGTEAAPSRIGRMLRLGDVELRPVDAIRQVVQHRPVLTAVVLSGLFAFVGWLVAQLVQSD